MAFHQHNMPPKLKVWIIFQIKHTILGKGKIKVMLWQKIVKWAFCIQCSSLLTIEIAMNFFSTILYLM